MTLTNNGIWIVLWLLLASTLANADPVDEAVKSLQKRWAEIQYQIDEDDRSKAFKTLDKEADNYLKRYSDSADLLIWSGIIKSSWAGAKGGLSALGLAKKAKKQLEKAIEIDAQALDGSAYTSLGVLYYQVPGWPLGFGDDKKAEKLLKQALAINPNGIDSNYFYGDFLYRDKKYKEAQAALRHALEAAPRKNRQLADQGRRHEIQSLLKRIDKKLED